MALALEVNPLFEASQLTLCAPNRFRKETQGTILAWAAAGVDSVAIEVVAPEAPMLTTPVAA